MKKSRENETLELKKRFCFDFWANFGRKSAVVWAQFGKNRFSRIFRGHHKNLVKLSSFQKNAIKETLPAS